MGRKLAITRFSLTIQVVLLAGLAFYLSVHPGKSQESAPPTARPMASENLGSFRLSQAVVSPPEITAYLEILTQEGITARTVTPDQVTAILGETPLLLKDMKPFRASGEGVAYILLVDISKSLKKNEFEQMRQVLFGWIDAMEEKDRAAILTFGTDVKQVHDFSPDKISLKQAVAILQPVDNFTQLHRGLVEALVLGRRIDKDLPMRRAIITLSDGQDDFAGGMTRQEVLRELKTDQVPIYAVGFSSPPKTAQKEEALKTLGEFARTSGVAYLRGEKGKFIEIFSRMREKIVEVYSVNLKCETCQWKGQEGRLQMDLRYGPVGMRTELGIVLLPRERFPEGFPLPEPGGPKAEEDSIWRKIPSWGYAGASFVFLALIVAAIMLLQRRERVPVGVVGGRPGVAKPDYSSPEPYQSSSIPLAADFTSYGGGPADPPLGSKEVNASIGAQVAVPKGGAMKGCRIRLTPIRSGEQTKPFEANLVNKLVVGRSKANCDLILPDDPEISKSHCELTYQNGVIHIVDLGSTNGTFVNGVPITSKYQLQNDDIIGLGKTELRFAMDDFKKK